MTGNGQRKSMDDGIIGNEFADMLADLESISTEPDSASISNAPSGKRKAFIRDAAKDYHPGGAKNNFDYEAYKRRLAEKARLQYRAEKVANGEKVRNYRTGLDAPSPDERKAERALAAKAAYRKAQGKDARPYMDLSLMTPEQKAEHKRKLAADRQKRRREKQERERISGLKANPRFGIF